MRRWLLVAWVVGVVGTFFLPSPLPIWLLCLIATIATMTYWIGVGKNYIVFIWLLILGILYADWNIDKALSRRWPLHDLSASLLSITVESVPERDDKRVRFVALAKNGTGQSYRLLLSDYKRRDWQLASTWEVMAKVKPPIGERNPAGFDREAWALVNDIDGVGSIGNERKLLARGRLNILQKWRLYLLQRWSVLEQRHNDIDQTDLLEPMAGESHHMAVQKNGTWSQEVVRKSDYSDGLALVKALSLGEQSALSSQSWQAFRRLGLNHLVSISGLHIGMVALLSAWIMRILMSFLPRIPSQPRLWMLIVGLLAALIYAFLSGFAVPAQRSILMLVAIAWVWWKRDAHHIWDAWWGSLAVILLINPFVVLSAGTWLSFGMTALLIAYAHYRVYRYPAAQMIKWWREWIYIQIILMIGSIPLLGIWFNSLPLLALPINLVAVPWFSWVLVPVALMAMFLPWEPLQIFAIALADYTMQVLYLLAKVAPQWPVAMVSPLLIVLAIIAVVLLILPRGWGLKPISIVVLISWLCYQSSKPEYGRARVTVWDVGQGLSVLVQTAHYQLIYDTGTESATQLILLPNLYALGIRYLNGLIFSHHDNDHDGGYDLLINELKPDSLWAGQPEFYKNAQSCVEQQLEIDGVIFEWLETGIKESGNDNQKSCVLRILAGEQALLMTGDLDKFGEAALLERYGDALVSQVLILGHHGSHSSSSGAFLNTVAPEYAVASSGFANSYGHPAEVVRSKLRAHRIHLLRTDYQGGMQFLLGGKELQVKSLSGKHYYWQQKPLSMNHK